VIPTLTIRCELLVSDVSPPVELRSRKVSPRKLFKEATAAARSICKERFEAFWCAGHASKIRALPLEKMARKYATVRQAAA
jgi:hypothetical protein